MTATKNSPKHGRSRRARGRRRLLRFRSLLAIPALLICLLGISFVGAALSPGNQDFEAKWADWLRAHHAGLVAQRFEELYYSATAPAKGGQPRSLNKIPVIPVTVGGTTTTTDPAPARTPNPTTALPVTTTTTHPPGLPAPLPVPLLVEPALAGEGNWQPTGPLVHGVPAMYVAQFRADDIYTSQITSAVWIDPKLLRLELVPGSTEPGGAWAPPVCDTLRTTQLGGRFQRGLPLPGRARWHIPRGQGGCAACPRRRFLCHLQGRPSQHR